MGTKGLRIGIDARTLGATGIGRYLNELLVAMAPQHPESHFHLFVRQDSTDLFDARLSALPNISTFVTPAKYYSLHEQLFWGQQIDHFGFDVIHFPNFNAPITVKTPYVATIHDLTLLRFPGRTMWPGKRWLYTKVLNHTLQKARRLLALSEWAASDIRSWAKEKGIPGVDQRLSVVPLAVSDVFRQAMTDRDLKAALSDVGIVNPFFLFVGAQLPHKNIVRVIEAFQRLTEAPEFKAYKLVIAGRRTVPAPHLDALLTRDLADRILFTDTVTDSSLRALYRGATALVFPSLTEGFGLPILEAQAAGTPVITSRVAAMPEVAGKGAILIDPTDTDAILNAMRRTVKKDAMASLVAAGSKNARTFSWKHTAEATYKIYLDAAKS